MVIVVVIVVSSHRLGWLLINWLLINWLLVGRLLVLGSGLQRELDQLLEFTPVKEDALTFWAVVDVDILSVHNHHDFGALRA